MLTEEHTLLRETLQQVVAREVAPRASAIDSQNAFPWEALKALKQVGLFGLLLPESDGGAGRDLLSFALGVECIAASSPSTAWIYVVHTSSTLGIASTGSDEQKNRLLPALVTGDRLATFAFTEPNAGADFAAIEARASRRDEAYVLDGSKCFISLAGEAEVYIVLARTPREEGPPGHSMFVIERATPGFSAEPCHRGMGMGGIAWGELRFDECRIPRENLLGEEGRGMRVLFGMANAYLLGGAALALGVAQGSFSETARHLSERRRKADDPPIGSLEALQFRMADMGAQVEAIRSLVYRACIDEDPRSSLPFAAKLFASETALDIARMALQLQGATGYAVESTTQRLLRDAFAIPLHFENNDFLRRFLGRTLIGI